MHLFTQLVLVSTAMLAPFTAYAGEVNCLGSHNCKGAGNLNNKMTVMTALISHAASLDSTMTFRDGDHIVCYGQICAFMEATGNVTTGDKIIHWLGMLNNQKCGTCGSVASIPGGDPKAGRMTVNFVQNPQGCLATCLDNFGNSANLTVSIDPPSTELLAKRDNVITVVKNPCPLPGAPDYAKRNQSMCDLPANKGSAYTE